MLHACYGTTGLTGGDTHAELAGVPEELFALILTHQRVLVGRPVVDTVVVLPFVNRDRITLGEVLLYPELLDT